MRYALVLLLGIVIGGAAIFFIFVGAPKAGKLPGTAVRPPDPGGDPPGTAVISLDERFFGSVMDAIFNDLQPPSIPLRLAQLDFGDSSNEPKFEKALFQGGCNDQVVLVREGSGVKSEIRFDNGSIVTPLAFTGSYNAPIFGCFQFKGWANAKMDLSFDQSKQTVFGRINVQSVNVEGIQQGANNAVTGLVQNAINQRVNPLEVLRPQQLTLAIPVQASNGTLKAQVKDVRSEINGGNLKLHITYDFSGTKNQ
jgi:hypothetical protein